MPPSHHHLHALRSPSSPSSSSSSSSSASPSGRAAASPAMPKDSSDFFLAGRGLTWPLIGISIVAANISTEQMVGMAGQRRRLGRTGRQRLAAGGLGLHRDHLHDPAAALPAGRHLHHAGVPRIPLQLAPPAASWPSSRWSSTSVVMLPAVLYSGGVTLRAIFGIPLCAGRLDHRRDRHALLDLRRAQGDRLGRPLPGPRPARRRPAHLLPRPQGRRRLGGVHHHQRRQAPHDPARRPPGPAVDRRRSPACGSS